MEGQIISMHDLFVFKQTGIDANRVAQGNFWSAGIRPQCMDQLLAQGIQLPLEMFESRKLTF